MPERPASSFLTVGLQNVPEWHRRLRAVFDRSGSVTARLARQRHLVEVARRVGVVTLGAREVIAVQLGRRNADNRR